MGSEVEMREQARIKRILISIKKLWLENPDLRFGQLLANITPEFNEAWNLEDSELEDLLKKEYKRIESG